MKSAKEILAQMTLEEKAMMLDGLDYWHLQSMEQYDIPAVIATDGPHGLRLKDYNKGGDSLNNSVPSICFPPACATAASWDEDAIYEMGVALGKKCLKEGVGVILGPGINMKRSPLCGRNFEYFSEDPVLAGNMAAGLINGVQSMGVGTSIKHFAVNSQETRRMTVNEVVDERALREIYLAGFELAIKKAKPMTVMSSYNRINGTYASENKHTLTEILRDEWGYEGMVVSDWGGINNRVDGVKAGNDLEMPSSAGVGTAKIIAAVKDGTLDEADVDKCTLRVLECIEKCVKAAQPGYEYNDLDDQPLARKIAGKCMVLMKNEDGILPLAKDKKIAVIGDMAKHPRYQGAGSSQINATQIDNAYDELVKMGYDVEYAQGYEASIKKEKKNPPLIKAAAELAGKCDIAVVFVGLTDDFESEGFDRQHMDMPASHNTLVEEVVKANPNTIVVLAGGSPVALPWNDSVKAILNSYLGGQAGGGAVADILSGAVNPSGKLPETYPVKYEDTPAYNFYPGNPASVEHREGIYIGYRYYDKAKKAVAYPFGYGLSYTTFEYSDLQLDKSEMADSDKLKVSFKVKNTGSVAGAEIAQIYVADKESTIYRPEKELKAFKKVYLEAGEEKEVSVELCKRAFAFWNVAVNDWTVESGAFDIIVGASSQDIKLTAAVNVTAEAVEIPDYSKTAPAYYTADVQNISAEEFVAVLGNELPVSDYDPESPVALTDSFESAARTKNGMKMFKLMKTVVPEGFAQAIALQVPLKNFISMSGGVCSESIALGLCKVLNGEKGGIRQIMKGIPKALKDVGPFLKTI